MTSEQAAEQVAVNRFLCSEQPSEDECREVAQCAAGCSSTTKVLLALAELYAGEFADEAGEELLREFAERMAAHEVATL
jgi:hypothetical protein